MAGLEQVTRPVSKAQIKRNLENIAYVRSLLRNKKAATDERTQAGVKPGHLASDAQGDPGKG
jgi:hypothetical protein